MEDDVCLDVLVSWLPGRLFNFFIWDSTMFFPPAKPGHHVIFFSIFFPPQPMFRFKILGQMQVAYGPVFTIPHVEVCLTAMTPLRAYSKVYAAVKLPCTRQE